MLSLWSSVTCDSILRRLGELVREGTYATAKLLAEPIKVVEARPVVFLATTARRRVPDPDWLSAPQRTPAIWRFRSGNCSSEYNALNWMLFDRQKQRILEPVPSGTVHIRRRQARSFRARPSRCRGPTRASPAP
jgi:hypothetical protein